MNAVILKYMHKLIQISCINVTKILSSTFFNIDGL